MGLNRWADKCMVNVNLVNTCSRPIFDFRDINIGPINVNIIYNPVLVSAGPPWRANFKWKG